MGRTPKNPCPRYTKEKLEAAVNAVKTKRMTYFKAQATFGVPKTTIENALKEKYPSSGRTTTLTYQEEQDLVDWIVHTAGRGFPITRIQLADSVQLFLNRESRTPLFTHNRPGKDWLRRFIGRHSAIIAPRLSENLSRSRAKLSEASIRKWFADVNQYLDTENVSTVLKDPRRVFNIDETGFMLNPTRDRVLAKRGQRNVYNVVLGNEKESVTVSLGFNAAGEMCPPLMVLNYARVPNWVQNDFPVGWTYQLTKSGWMTGEAFFKYMSEDFMPWIYKQNIPLPIIVFVDGHTSHLTLTLSEFCSSNKVILVALYPNATHMLQPMDVGFFKPLKQNWKTARDAWNYEHPNDIFKRENLAPLLKTTIDKTLENPQTIPNTFRTCGNSIFIYLVNGFVTSIFCLSSRNLPL